MSAMQAQRREDSGPLHERSSAANSRQSNGAHPFSSILSSTSNDGVRTSSAANLAALVPPSMRSHTSATSSTGERRYSDSSESSSSSRRRKRNSPQLPLASKGSSDSVDMGNGYRSQSPPRPSPSKLSPPRERRRRSSLSDVSVSTAEEERSATTPPPVAFTVNNRPVRASDYAPLPETTGEEDAPGRSSPPMPKLARPRFGHEPVTVPQAPTFGSATAPSAAPPSVDVEVAEPSNTKTTAQTSTVDAPLVAATTTTSGPEGVAAPPEPPVESSQRPLPPPPLRHGAPPAAHDGAPMPPMTAPPPIAPRNIHSASASDAEARVDATGFTPLPEIPAEKPRGRHDRPQSSRTATPEQAQGANRTRSARRLTQSVQTARARAQQRRTAASSSPHSRHTPVTPQPETSFPGAKRLDDDHLPLSTKLVLGAACVVGVALVFYLGRSVYRYASGSIMEPGAPVPQSKFARARMPKKAVVTDKDAAKLTRDIRDRIVTNMHRAVKVQEER